ncbi:hypothetical protein [Streptomyces sp. NPDC048385]|uniref:hypothetical protein n=1 Tax=Streptomyces sp. NPDC048385 TaxID=3155145 RepID=UPI003434962F
MPVEDRLVLQWVAKASRPLVDLHDPVLARDVLESLRRKLDGGEAAVETMRRKRKVMVHALHYAVERGELGSHPLNKVRWRVPKPAVTVDPRVVANPHQARDLLDAVSYSPGRFHQSARRLQLTRTHLRGTGRPVGRARPVPSCWTARTSPASHRTSG